jgi:YD repeat-containing protein
MPRFLSDMFDRLTQELTPQGTVAYAYDVLSRRTSMTAKQTRVGPNEGIEKSVTCSKKYGV